MKFILIVVWYTVQPIASGGSVTVTRSHAVSMQEFENKGACESAAKYLNAVAPTTLATCISKS